MAQDFVHVITPEEADHTATTSRATSEAFVPAVGMVAKVSAGNSVGTAAALAQPTATWTLVRLEPNTTSFMAVLRCTAVSSPASNVCTFTSSDNFIDMTFMVLEPTELSYNSVVGFGNTAGANAATLDITITPTGTPAAFLAFAHANAGTMTPDADSWNEIFDENNASGATHAAWEKYSTDTVITLDASVNTQMIGIVLQFDAVGGGGGTGKRRLLKSKLVTSQLVGQSPLVRS